MEEEGVEIVQGKGEAGRRGEGGSEVVYINCSLEEKGTEENEEEGRKKEGEEGKVRGKGENRRGKEWN